jgi:6-phosphofructokinase 1
VNVIGIPKTIDKDLPETEYTLGYDTALNVIIEEVDRLRTTAGSHKRIFVVETMGRTAGWLALRGGEACGAYIILIPEHDFSLERVSELVMEGRRSGARYEIVIVAEGAKKIGGTEIVEKEGVDSFGHKALGGVGQFVAEEIEKGTGLETRSVTLSHLQRGGAPSAYDRRMGRYYGIAAIDLVVKEDYGKMVCLKGGEITSTPLENIYGKLNRVNPDIEYDKDRYNGRRTIIS